MHKFKLAQRVEIISGNNDVPILGTICSHLIKYNYLPIGHGTNQVYFVKLDKPEWTASKNLWITIVPILPSNLIPIL